MTRLFAVAAASAAAALSGCASTWETVSSRRFRADPFGVMFKADDPMTVLRTSREGDARARAMRALKEPAAAGRPQADQDEAVQVLSEAATTDPSPWVRMAAVDALGRFADPRAADALVAAYHQAPGRPAPTAPEQPVARQVAAGGRTLGEPGLLSDRLGLHGPQGFPADQVMTIQGRAVEALARTGRPEAVAFLGRVAAGDEALSNEDPGAREFVRQRAVAGLGRVRQKDAVVALAKVLSAEAGRDITLTHLAHGGLVDLTGQTLPADPDKWNGVVQAGGFEIAPEKNAVERAFAPSPD